MVGIVGTLIVVLVIGVAAVFYWFSHRGENAGNASSGGKNNVGRPMPVVTATARKGALPIYVDALGSVLPLNTVTVRTRVDGQVDKIIFVEGQTVKQGELLAQIDPRPFQVQLENAEGQFARDQATLKNAQVELDRDRRAGDAIPKQQVDTQQSAVDTAAAAIKIDQAAIDSAKLQLDYCRIVAPFAGVIGLRLVDQGNIVHASDTTGLAVITQVQPISVVFSISEDRLPDVLKHTDDGSQRTVDAYDRNLTNRIATGKLVAIDNQVDSTTGMIRLKGEFPNENRALYPNQFVNARLLVSTVKNATIIPSAAVQRGPDGTFVYIAKDNGTVEIRKVTLGDCEGDDQIITEGLAAGETVVTDGVDKLVQGSKVEMKKGGATTKPSGNGESAAAGGKQKATSPADSAANSNAGSNQ